MIEPCGHGCTAVCLQLLAVARSYFIRLDPSPAGPGRNLRTYLTTFTSSLTCKPKGNVTECVCVFFMFLPVQGVAHFYGNQDRQGHSHGIRRLKDWTLYTSKLNMTFTALQVVRLWKKQMSNKLHGHLPTYLSKIPTKAKNSCAMMLCSVIILQILISKLHIITANIICELGTDASLSV